MNLVSVASSRLALSQTFAEWAWQQAAAGKNEDPQRDDVTEQGLITLAPHYGLDASYATRIIQDQTAAAEQLQKTLFAAWKAGDDSPPKKPDDERYQSARSDMYRVSQTLLGALTQIQPLRDRDDCPMLLSQAITRWTTQITTLPSAQKAALSIALGHVCRDGVGATG